MKISALPGDNVESKEGVLRINADFDEQNKNKDGNPLADYQPDEECGHNVWYDDTDLLDAFLSISGDSAKGRWRLIFPENIRVWIRVSDTTHDEVISSSFSEELQVPFSCQLKIEGIKGSQTTNDVRILAEFAPGKSKAVYRDSIFLTILETKFVVTFDDGPFPDKTEKILRALRSFHYDGKPVKAGFFQIAENIHKSPELTRLVNREGHFIFNRAVFLERGGRVMLFSGGMEQGILQWEEEMYNALGRKTERIIRKRYKRGRQFLMELKRLNGKVCGGELTYDFRALSVGMVLSRAREILEGWNNRENPQLHPYPAILIFHEFPRVTYDHIGEVLSYLQDQGFLLVNFDPTLIY